VNALVKADEKPGLVEAREEIKEGFY